MFRLVNLLFLFFVTLCTLNTFALVPPPDVSNDSVIIDLKNAAVSFNSGERFLDIPIIVKAKNPVSSFDIRLKFNQDKFEYISTIKVNAQLEPFTFLNTNDNFLRNNTAGPFVSFNIPNNTPLIYFRFKLKQTCALVNASDFFQITTLLLGYPSKNKVTEMESVKTFLNLLVSGSKCTKSALTFAGPTSSSGVPITEYKWEFGNGSFSNTQSVNTSFVDPGEYDIKLVVKTVDGCKDSTNQSIYINESPIASFDYTTSESLDTVYFNNLSSVTNDEMTFEWNFGDKSASFTNNPKHHYASGGVFPVELIVRTLNGCFARSVVNVVLEKPIADFDYTANACANTDLVFEDKSVFNFGKIVDWNWDFGDNTTSSIKNSTHKFLLSGKYVVKLIVISDKGIKSEVSKTIEINNRPIVNFEANTTSGCSPLYVSFSNNSIYDLGSRFIYDFGDDQMSIQPDPVQGFIESKSYTIKKVIITPGGCKDSLIKTSYITVSPNPIVSFGKADGCLNTLLNFSDSSKVDNGSIVAWDWNFGDGFSVYTKNAQHTFNKSGKYPIKLTVTSNKGCSESFQDSIQINTKPKVQFNAEKTDGCIPLTPVFKDFSTTVAGSTYNWDFGDKTFSFDKNPSKIYQKDGKFSVKLTVVAPGGCADSLIIPNYINPLSLVTAKFTESTHCANRIMQFTDSSTVSNGKIANWNWSFGNGVFSSQSNPSTVFQKSGNYTVSLTVTSDQGCQNITTKEISIDDVPKVNFAADKTNGCFPDVIIFDNKSTFMEGSKFEWHFGDGFKQTFFAPAHKYMDIDSFTVKCIGISPQGCKDSLVKEKYISIQISPISKFEIENKKVLIPGFKINFTNLSTTAKDYVWSFGDSTISAFKNPAHQFLDSGSFKVCLTAKNSEYCKSVYCENVQIRYPGNIAVPNAFSPNNDGKNDVFKVLGGPISEMSLKVYNTWGSLVFSSESQNEGWDGNFAGEKQPIGEYNYLLIGKLTDGSEINKTGVINLTR